MTYDPIANFERVDIEAIPHGEIVTTIEGKSVFIKRPGGRVRYRAVFMAHFAAHPGGFCSVGQVFLHDGIEWVVESVRFSGLSRIKGADGQFFDGRSYEITAMATQAYDCILDIEKQQAGGAP